MYFCKKEMKFKAKNGGDNIEDQFLHNRLSKFEITNYEDYISYTNSSSFVGTAEYASPELLMNNVTNSQSVDIWALGCIIYKLFHGFSPFIARNDMLIFQNIINMKYKLMDHLPEDARDLISKLLIADPEKRLGCGEKGSGYDFEALKSHTFFKDVTFENIHLQNPPIDAVCMSPKNSFNEKALYTTTCMSNKFKALYDINLDCAEFNISYFDCPENMNISTVIQDQSNNFRNCESKDFTYDKLPKDFYVIDDYVKINEESFLDDPSILHEKILKKKGWIIYNVVKLRLLSNGRLETLDFFSNELLVSYYN